MRPTSHFLAGIALLLSVAIALQVWRDRGWAPYEPTAPVLWLDAGPSMKRLWLGYETLAADLYWIRAVVYFGRQRQSRDPNRDFGLLHPLLDVVTTLDPLFTVAYRFGAIFLSEAVPNGPGRPDLAIELLERGVKQSPEKWEYLHDLGFVYYWHFRDFRKAADCLERASTIPGAPVWLKSTAAAIHGERGDRESARLLWRQIRDAAENESLRHLADVRLQQFASMDAIDQLNEAVQRFQGGTGRIPRSWDELVNVRLLRGIPLDPTGVPFELDPQTAKVDVARRSPLWPLPQGFSAPPQ